MSDEIQEKFDATVKALLNMPPVKQKALAARGRQKRILRKVAKLELERLIRLLEAVQDHSIEHDEMIVALCDSYGAIESCLRELRDFRNSQR